ncbi:restriction endonuclease subunit S [Blautia sp. MSK22_86]|uniref:restriction endonuclease subunit S n=2 Tax=Blautia TaxID=572511 RepID=UPI001D10D1A8|nr:restriction endonuclease subunit S [Blautia sp. MSK22_86]MCC2724726.1 restriction endonuclease subunit S [Blautia sp. MSK22_86]
MKRLADICDIQYGYAFDSKCFTEDSSYPQLVRIRDVKRGYSETYYSGNYPDEYILSEGDLLIGMDGEFNIARWKCSGALLNQRVCKLTTKVGTNEEYLRFAMLKSLKEIEQRTAFVTVKHLSAKELNKLELDVPELTKQDKIADTLSRLERVIEARKEELEKLDELIKARFVEMFGDPVANDMGWNTLPLENACKSIVDCPHSTPSYTNEDTGFMCIRTSIIKKNKILWNDIEYISEDEFVKRIQRKKPEVGDIVYTREGAILGIAAIIDRDCNVALGQRSMLLSPDIDKCTSEFVCVAMNSDSFLDNVLKGVSGSASPHINVGNIKAFRMIMPPIELQKQFSNFVTQVDKSKFINQFL